MADALASKLSRRERQIMDLLFQRGSATAAEVLEGMPDPPSYSAVRAMLRTLEEKGHVRHREEGPRYVYRPTVSAERARRQAAGHLTRTFFGGKPSRTILALLDMSAEQITREELDEIASRIDRAARKSSE